jgi:hypothetical protein
MERRVARIPSIMASISEVKLGRGVLHHVADTRQYDPFRPC